MQNSLSDSYWVRPLPPAPKQKGKLPPLVSSGEAGCALVVLPILVIIFLLTLLSSLLQISSLNLSETARSAFEVTIIVLVVAGTLTLLFVSWCWKIWKSEQEDLAARLAAAEREATEVARRAVDLLEGSLTGASQLRTYLDNASSWLARAVTEYDEHAYAPFWDAVEQSAVNLGAFRDLSLQLSRSSTVYYRLLSGRTHNLPALDLSPKTLPDPTAVLAEFRRVSRKGETDRDFSNIWGHMKTHEVLIDGFRNLGDAISNLGPAVQIAFNDLKGAVSSDMAQLIQEQVRSREQNAEQASEHLNKLDQIHQRIRGR